MPFSYQKLFNLLKTKNITTYTIRKDKIISETTLQKLRDNKHISTKSLESLCKALNCQPGDIMEYIPDSDNVPNSSDSDVEQ